MPLVTRTLRFSSNGVKPISGGRSRLKAKHYGDLVYAYRAPAIQTLKASAIRIGIIQLQRRCSPAPKVGQRL